ncbi:hypothetical protein [Actinoplanes utahensis]|uniref:Uncharacterized protein n=1 Tax=Actinoplanes utahensis TaxID=1869 RepID=A0A0A6UP13_ACTUT|nr:hypothetical protein [Actinoplanes utahensis]KHD77875.1 hypothetical protein MB27_08835 [Actinoplanes utahensis]GIF32436.1 hypothetical protein Aut01nite_54220 [Actinoplanes utahensis]
MSKLRMAAGVTTVAGLALLAGATPAYAESVTADCKALLGRYHSTAVADYTTQGATQHWINAQYRFTSASPFPVGNKSNVNFRLRHSPDGVSHSTSHKTYFAYDSPDALRPNIDHTTPINKDTPVSENIYVKFDTIFDLPNGIPDVNCEAYTPFV